MYIKKLLLVVLGYAGLLKRFVFKDKRYLLFQFLNYTRLMNDQEHMECEDFYFLPSQELKIELGYYPDVSKKKINKIIYYNLKSRFQEASEKIGFFFIILGRDKLKRELCAALFIYNKDQILNQAEKNFKFHSFFFDVFPYILWIKHFNIKEYSRFVFQVGHCSLFIEKNNKQIESIKIVDQKDNDPFLEPSRLYPYFLRTQNEIYGSSFTLSWPERIKIFMRKIAVYSLFTSLFFCFVNPVSDYLMDKYSFMNKAKITADRKMYLETEKIKQEFNQFETDKLFLAQNSIWFYSLYSITREAGDYIYFSNLSFSDQKGILYIEGYTEKFEDAQQYIKKVSALKLFQNVNLETMEQYLVNGKEYLKFKIKIFIKNL